ncbi:hypothetical protein GGX14DRAFT_572303 [Mycena pura]|uniref:Uncharacterized protein n=1 Tax=Mycena pura TaxID=153505 RepID=A0AAD6V254_9AGAR|nr:hypothetical protein GGX14DRAFT_572303 [Mycena pura]
MVKNSRTTASKPTKTPKKVVVKSKRKTIPTEKAVAAAAKKAAAKKTPSPLFLVVCVNLRPISTAAHVTSARSSSTNFELATSTCASYTQCALQTCGLLAVRVLLFLSFRHRDITHECAAVTGFSAIGDEPCPDTGM